MKKILILLTLISAFINTKAQNKTSFVDPFLGTGGHGHVYPGATVPFGMVQLSPDNGDEGWDWCSGYHYSSKTIAGFSHTHLNGTGIGDWCDISVLPLIDSANANQPIIKHSFNHSNENAKPGYYSVKLDNGILCELSATERTGIQQYSFPSTHAWLRYDMGFKLNWDQPTDGFIQIINDSTIGGYRYSTGWAKNQRVYFTSVFSSKIKSYRFIDAQEINQSAQGKTVKILLEFESLQKRVTVKTGISNVSIEKASTALSEVSGKSFQAIVANAENKWEGELNKIEINTNDKAFATKFYTALYRTALAPVIYSDKDGEYKNQQGQKHKMDGDKARYTIFSLWDTFRALNPLFTITQPQLVPDLINSMLQFYKENGLLPVWDISSWEANTMTGYHSIPVIADAILKDIQGFNVDTAYEAMLKSAFQKQRGTSEYIQYGYLPQDKHGWSVTITLEYAYDDWCIAQVAKKLGKKRDYAVFMERAKSYQNLFDASTGFMRAKNSQGFFIEPFDPLLSEHGFEGQYIEGTAWQHSFFVPHDIDGLSALYGGKKILVNKLDALFNAPSVLHGENASADVSGLIGQYAHGNEPSHHIIYMYSALGYPDKAAKWIKAVADSFYKTGPDGLIGNDDCGQMSAWYIFSALGLYPMNPASGEYVFGFPLVKNASIQLSENKKLAIKVIKKGTNKDAYIRSVLWNGKKINQYFITHNEIIKGGMLTYIIE